MGSEPSSMRSTTQIAANPKGEPDHAAGNAGLLCHPIGGKQAEGDGGDDDPDGLARWEVAAHAKRRRRLWDAYCFPGFRSEPTVCGVFGDPKARVIRLKRRSKKRRAAVAVASRWAGTTARFAGCAICRAATRGFSCNWRCAASVRRLDAVPTLTIISFLQHLPTLARRLRVVTDKRAFPRSWVPVALTFVKTPDLKSEFGGRLSRSVKSGRFSTSASGVWRD